MIKSIWIIKYKMLEVSYLENLDIFLDNCEGRVGPSFEMPKIILWMGFFLI